MDENIKILSDIINLNVDGKTKSDLISEVKDLISENISLKRDIEKTKQDIEKTKQDMEKTKQDMEKTKQDMEKSRQRHDLMDAFYKIAAEGANCFAQCYAIKHSSVVDDQVDDLKDIEFDFGKRPDSDTVGETNPQFA
mgnify:CR=1 FL=1